MHNTCISCLIKQLATHNLWTWFHWNWYELIIWMMTHPPPPPPVGHPVSLIMFFFHLKEERTFVKMHYMAAFNNKDKENSSRSSLHHRSGHRKYPKSLRLLWFYTFYPWKQTLFTDPVITSYAKWSVINLSGWIKRFCFKEKEGLTGW